MRKKRMLRPEKTDEALFKAFENVIKTHSLNDITVAVIIKEANIHRSTFYSHFEDKYELAKAYLLKRLEDINDVVETLLNETPEVRLAATVRFFRLLKSNKDAIDTAMRNIGRETCFNCLEEGSGRIIGALIKTERPPEDIDREYLARYMTGAFVGVTKWWVNNDMEMSPERLASEFYRICEKIMR